MKKLLSIVLIIILSSLCGCEKNSNTLENIEAFSTLSKKDIKILTTPLSEKENYLKADYAIVDDLIMSVSYTPTELETQMDNYTPISYPADASNLPSVHTITQALLNPHSNSLNATVRGVEDRFGIDYLRNTEGNGLYSIHLTKEGGYFYIFYKPEAPHTDWYDIGNSGILATFYVEKKLSQADFKSIKKGSTFNDVKAIDPTVQIAENIHYAKLRYRLSRLIEMPDYTATMHYTSDGIIEIGYRFKNGKWKVEEIVNKGFEALQINAIRIAADAKILDMDWPQSS